MADVKTLPGRIDALADKLYEAARTAHDHAVTLLGEIADEALTLRKELADAIAPDPRGTIEPPNPG